MTRKERTWTKRVRKVCPPTAQDAGGSVVLPETLDLAAARPLAEAFLARRGNPIVVDALGVQRPGAACLQVLLSAAATWARDDVPFSFVNCGPLLIEHLKFLGVDPASFQKGA